MKLEFLEEFYVRTLADLLDAENQLVAALPKMAKSASSPELRQAFELHHKQTEQHAARLKEVLASHKGGASKASCKGMQGIIAEAQEELREDAEPGLLDVALVAAAQKVEHYEIAGYGCATAYARQLELNEEAKILHQTLEEERETDGKLTALAKELINPQAAAGDVLETEK